MMYNKHTMASPMANSMANPFFGEIQHKGLCIPQETAITNVRLARAYVPFQRLCNLFSPEEALEKGTVFPELYSPYFKKEHAKTKMSPLMEKCGDDYE